MAVICSFCEESLLQSKHIVIKGKYSVCRECVLLIKEVFDEFSRSETYESGGICSFCNNTHSISNKVFQGKKINICNNCFDMIQVELEDKLMVSTPNKNKELDHKNRNQDAVYSLVRPEIRELKAYSVPSFKCSIKLDGNESPFPLDNQIRQQIIDGLNKIDINRYPDPGADDLRKTISEYSRVQSSNILLGNGSDELIEMIIRTFSSGSGKILIPSPTFSMYKISTITLGYEPVEVELDNSFDIDLTSTLKYIETHNPDIIFLATPNNPTGNNFSKDRIVNILDVFNGIVVIDEAYHDFSGISYLEFLAKYKNLIILRTLSKIGFAALRLGMLFASKDVCETINKVRLPYNINSFTQYIAKIALDNMGSIVQNNKIIIQERERVLERLQIIPGVEVFNSHANFILLRVQNSKRVFQQLIDKEILVRVFESPERLKNCLRVTIGTEQENESFLKALSSIISS